MTAPARDLQPLRQVQRVALFVLAAATFTGFLLPWDQLALWAVTVGTNMKGYTPVFGSQVRFALLGGVEVTQATLWRWFVVHTIVLTVALGGLTAVVVWLGPRRRPSTDQR
ncbi:MAG: putative menaquinol-cytochrome c reductase cytochrome b subunit [Acidimicrobiales bacterium]|nr:putative menaquinol-cytochrome c reductase cytochrome b subunit [Acidimicrobiales bacterium]